MLSQITISGVVTVVSLAHAIRTQIKARNAANLYIESHKTFEESEAKAAAQILYLIHMLERHNIEPTEYDLIALTNIVNA